MCQGSYQGIAIFCFIYLNLVKVVSTAFSTGLNSSFHLFIRPPLQSFFHPSLSSFCPLASQWVCGLAAYPDVIELSLGTARTRMSEQEIHGLPSV